VRSRVLAAVTVLGTLGALLASIACSTSAPSRPTTVSSVLVAGAAPAVGSTSQFTAVALSSDGSTQSVSSQVTWSSSNLSIASVNGSGSVTGVSAGEVDITATYGGVTGGLHIAIVPPLAMYTLSVTLAQGHHLSGPYAAMLTGPGGFACVMSQSQESVNCPVALFPSGTVVPIVVTITVPSFANDVPIWATSGCDSTTRNTCTVLMDANRAVTIKAGST